MTVEGSIRQGRHMEIEVELSPVIKADELVELARIADAAGVRGSL